MQIENGAIRDGPAIVAATRVAMDIVSVPVFTLRPDCLILDSNRTGNDLLRVARMFYRSQDRRLVIRRKSDAIVLAETVARVATTKQSELIRFLTRQDEVTALVRVEPVPGQDVVVVCVAELRATMLLEEGWAKLAFGFSPQNASLAESLAIGVNLSEFSQTRRLPIGTVRTRMKKLLAQTGMNSQAALAAVLLRGATIMTGSESVRGTTKR
jgi:hypothetical protein